MAAKNVKLSQILRQTRKRSGLSREALADLAGVGKTLIFDLEHGHETVQFDKLQRVCRVLNIRIHFDAPMVEA